MSVRSAGFILGAVILLCGATGMRADTVTTFNANGLLDDGAVIGGTLTVDVTSGAVESSYLTASNGIDAIFTSITQYHQSYGGTPYDLIYDATADGQTQLNFSVSPSFVGFAGGGVNGGNIFYPHVSPYYGPNIVYLGFSMPVANTPEPSTLLLIGSALAGLPALRRPRRRVSPPE